MSGPMADKITMQTRTWSTPDGREWYAPDGWKCEECGERWTEGDWRGVEAHDCRADPHQGERSPK